ncbi:DUF3261 domain-containing protein [Azospirillum sp. TSO35-2]|uniref:DUF3261 domain-containing protein n=1 Tax=Azospirillum sp. TSO35-2 TaxID=716796 RepID=UPI000D60CFF0|nr:DUF3261 domain-containing protein [Azospirillum sp. TSO35-2]PWC35983.1 hypothetical protein TSO352_12390 [Azospirillum sp. TSO35-2]
MTRHAWIALALTLGGCVAAPAPDPREPLLAPDQRITLPRPGDLGRRVEAVQLITGRHGDQTFVFEGHLSVTPERLMLVGLDTLGRRAMTLTWTDAGVEVETAPWLPASVRPGSMLADLVVLYWPEAVVRRALAAAGGDLTEEPHARTVRLDGKELLHADHSWTTGGPWTGTMHYVNRAWGYEIDVQSQEAAP